MVEPIRDFSVELLQMTHLWITWGIFWGAAFGAYLTYKSPPKHIHSAQATLGYLIIIALIGPVATARFLLEFPDVIPWLENESLLVLVTGHLVALAWTWVLVTMSFKRYRKERKKP